MRRTAARLQSSVQCPLPRKNALSQVIKECLLSLLELYESLHTSLMRWHLTFISVLSKLSHLPLQNDLQDSDTSELQMRSKIQNNGMSLGSQQGVATELSELDHASSGFEIQGLSLI